MVAVACSCDLAERSTLCWSELVDLTALADKRRHVEVILFDGRPDGLSHGGQVWAFARGSHHAGGNSRRLGGNRGTMRNMRYMGGIYHSRNRRCGLHLIRGSGAGCRYG